MIYLDEQNKLLNLFNINKFNQLNNAIFNIAPSIIDYNLSNLIDTLELNITFNKSQTQDMINIDKYTIYCDYNDNIFIEYDNYQEDYETQSLW